MAQKPRCKKCGRALRNPISIARGLGPVCAGGNGKDRQRYKSRSNQSSVRTYETVGSGSTQLFAPVQSHEAPKRQPRKRERLRLVRMARKTSFLSRQSFKVGINARTREPVIFNPVGTDGWIDLKGKHISHENLGRYLQLYHFI